jgi:hypothetical protein
MLMWMRIVELRAWRAAAEVRQEPRHPTDIAVERQAHEVQDVAARDGRQVVSPHPHVERGGDLATHARPLYEVHGPVPPDHVLQIIYCPCLNGEPLDAESRVVRRHDQVSVRVGAPQQDEELPSMRLEAFSVYHFFPHMHVVEENEEVLREVQRDMW